MNLIFKGQVKFKLQKKKGTILFESHIAQE